MHGGEVINSGGFGCIFKPALKCKGKTREKNKITKLMTRKNSLLEYNEITKFKKVLKKIPHYNNYFLLNNITLCTPAKLTAQDLQHYNTKCKALQKDDILNASQVNKNIHHLMAINMQDGGIDLGDYIDTITYNKMPNVNDLLLDLLVNGIIPMNKLNIYHSDVKDSNILVDVDNNVVRLIDWGLSTEYKPQSKIPRVWLNRPFQFNVPFSSILFNNTFTNMYTQFLKNNTPTHENIRPFVIDYIYEWNKKRGSGHLDAYNRIFSNLYIDKLLNIPSELKDKIIMFDFTLHYITEYITNILITYTHSKKINLIHYLNDIYKKNIDIWGFIMCYNPIIERLSYHYGSLNPYEMQVFDHLKDIFIRYLFTFETSPIDTHLLVVDLKKLNVLFSKCEHISSTTQHSFNGTSAGINTDVYDTEKTTSKIALFKKSKTRRLH